MSGSYGSFGAMDYGQYSDGGAYVVQSLRQATSTPIVDAAYAPVEAAERALPVAAVEYAGLGQHPYGALGRPAYGGLLGFMQSRKAKLLAMLIIGGYIYFKILKPGQRASLKRGTKSLAKKTGRVARRAAAATGKGMRRSGRYLEDKFDSDNDGSSWAPAGTWGD